MPAQGLVWHNRAGIFAIRAFPSPRKEAAEKATGWKLEESKSKSKSKSRTRIRSKIRSKSMRHNPFQSYSYS
jgi:hypothetical protein